MADSRDDDAGGAQGADDVGGASAAGGRRRRRRGAARPGGRPAPHEVGRTFARTFAPAPLYDKAKRDEWQLETGRDRRGPYIVELNVQHAEGLAGAHAAFLQCHAAIASSRTPEPATISRTYLVCRLTWSECRRLLREDERRAQERSEGSPGREMRHRSVYKLWPDFPVRSQIYRSLPTIKANAAQRSFEAEGAGVVWAVVDSGVDASHPHFDTHRTLTADEVTDLHRTFVDVGGEYAPGVPREAAPLADPDEAGLDPDERARRVAAHRAAALRDGFGHGTHVAGIVAGAAPTGPDVTVRLFERVERTGRRPDEPERSSVSRTFDDAVHLHGAAPKCRLVSLKVLDDDGVGRSSDVIRALVYIRERLNDNPKMLRVHGVNLSVGYEFDAEMFACGQSPICAEVDRLVKAGVVVVAAAGNTGYGQVAASERTTHVGLSNTINDPGNADLAITVGSTHRDAPYMYGVSYFSSKGPTGDGRLKPDLVAPGERITSCAAGKRLDAAVADTDAERGTGSARFADYVEDSGTSMAAPHVSGAVAAFLSIRREFIGRPQDVKRIFTTTASPLGRERYFEGHGLVDLIRAIQSV
ncbi:S8 family peptidase [Phycicoccus flavus]|uniref:S8 family peptidase n=1 Tax=Phycicoccus flavus TaxID=2502783 RepID=UPI000FEC0680|nr:S8 family peptidase [Phycicoccus flavus]NHA69820.1 S8 family peptidase [Phycicoccus flavus]